MKVFKQVDQARKILGLPDYATLRDITAAYRKVVLRYHSNECKGVRKEECQKLLRKAARAKDVLLVYCAGYKYSFKEGDIGRNSSGKVEALRWLTKKYFLRRV